MPSGKTHEDINRKTAILLIFFLIAKHYPLTIPIFLTTGLVWLSLLFSSDLDQANSRPLKRWGYFKILWKPYTRFGHREVLHHWFWGAIILCLIPGIFIFIIIYYTHYFPVLWILPGLFLSVELHIAADKF